MQDNALSYIRVNDGSDIDIVVRNGNNSYQLSYAISNTGEAVDFVEMSTCFDRMYSTCILRIRRDVLTKIFGEDINDISKKNNADVSFDITIRRTLPPKLPQSITATYYILDVTENILPTGPYLTLNLIDVYGFKLFNKKYTNVLSQLSLVLNSKESNTPLKIIYNIMLFLRYGKDTLTSLKEGSEYEEKRAREIGEVLINPEIRENLEYKNKISNEYTRLTKGTIKDTETDNANFINIVDTDAPFPYIQKYCRMHNIKMYRDWKDLNIISSLDYSKLHDYTKEHQLTLSEVANKNEDNYIYQSVKTMNTDNTLSKITYTNTNSKGGTKSTDDVADVKTFEKMIRISTNDIVSNWSDDGENNQSNAVDHNICTAYYDLAKKYNKRQVLILYINALLDLQVGNLINVYLQSEESDPQKQLEGDTTYNGKWIVHSITIKKSGQCSLVSRLGLHRYDVPKLQTEKANPSAVTEEVSTKETANKISKSSDTNVQDNANSNETVYPEITNAEDVYDHINFKEMNNDISYANNNIESFNDLINNINPFVNIYETINNVRVAFSNVSNTISKFKNSVNEANDAFKSLKNMGKNFKSEIKDGIAQMKESFSFDNTWSHSQKFQLKAILTQAKNLNKDIKNLNRVLTSWDYTTTTETMKNIYPYDGTTLNLLNTRDVVNGVIQDNSENMSILKAQLKERQRAQVEKMRQDMIISGAIKG